MATRREMQERRLQLREALLAACRDGKLLPDQAVPPMRELGRQHGISAASVCQVIKGLVDEGVLYARQGAGTFVGRPQKATVEPYLMLVPPHATNRESFWGQAQAGFEDRIAQLGGHSIVLTPSEAYTYLQHNGLPQVAGAFIYNEEQFQNTNVPSVLFGVLEGGERADYINFDDVEGGVQATRHLWHNGHRSIAFLALHRQGDAHIFPWSERREMGWRKALEQAGAETTDLVFHPRNTLGSGHEEQVQAGLEIAQKLVELPEISAVVAANIFVAEGMFQAFEDVKWPAERWPAVVCFDAAPQAGGSIVSYLRLPWEEIGREAAQILWERHTGRLQGAHVQRLVPMRLIARLSCRSDWAKASGLTHGRISESASRTSQIMQEPVSVSRL